MDPVPDSLLPRKSGSAENRTRDLWVCKDIKIRDVALINYSFKNCYEDMRVVYIVYI
jgi:hypothetical protein